MGLVQVAMHFTSKLLNDLPVKHAFFSRKGGFSTGLLSSFNFVVKDNDEVNVEKNFSKVANFFSVQPQHIKTVYQIHSTEVVVIKDSQMSSTQINADAIVTNLNQIVLGIKSADCCPILMVDYHNNIIAAVHAGWRGAFTGIITNAITAMLNLGAQSDKISAVIGPTIAWEFYEVDSEFYKKFIAQDKNNNQFFSASIRPNHYMFNLPGYVEGSLLANNVNSIDNLMLDTYSNEDNFFSCRRAFHKNEPTFGCQLSAIMLD